ncbi:MAG: hypothetical protein HND48_03605 [Chloroflexi bacterium]|nr:hypothetical protein [Chloroflexota bacterium]
MQSATSVPVGTSVVIGFDELLDPATVTGVHAACARCAVRCACDSDVQQCLGDGHD